MKTEDLSNYVFQSDDKFYSNVFEKQYEANWEGVCAQQFSEFAEVMHGARIVGIEPIADGGGLAGVILYLKKRNKKFVVSLKMPNEWDEEQEMYIDICCE